MDACYARTAVTIAPILCRREKGGKMRPFEQNSLSASQGFMQDMAEPSIRSVYIELAMADP